MTADELKRVADWFDLYVAAFCGATDDEQRNYDLKIEHTRRVRENIARLAIAQQLLPEERNLAEAIAICHDVGRFPQYRDYRTFNDRISINHAALAVQVLRAERVLDDIDSEYRNILLKAVAMHNAFLLPEVLDPLLRPYLLLIRDADKLDIWRVLIEYCAAAPEQRASAVTWELPVTGLCSQGALEEVIAGRMPNRDLLRTVDDIKLLQLSWAYDLNFNESYRIFSERRYLDRLAELLPVQAACGEAVSAVRNFVRRRLQEEGMSTL